MPLPSIAGELAALMTGNGVTVLTGVATPAANIAGTCIGTRLPELSTPVANDWVVVFASFTNSATRVLLF